jgi:hypothetical protein
LRQERVDQDSPGVGVDGIVSHPWPGAVQPDEGQLDKIFSSVPVAAQRIGKPAQRLRPYAEVLNEPALPVGADHHAPLCRQSMYSPERLQVASGAPTAGRTPQPRAPGRRTAAPRPTTSALTPLISVGPGAAVAAESEPQRCPHDRSAKCAKLPYIMRSWEAVVWTHARVMCP